MLSTVSATPAAAALLTLCLSITHASRGRTSLASATSTPRKRCGLLTRYAKHQQRLTWMVKTYGLQHFYMTSATSHEAQLNAQHNSNYASHVIQVATASAPPSCTSGDTGCNLKGKSSFHGCHLTMCRQSDASKQLPTSGARQQTLRQLTTGSASKPLPR